MSVVNTAGTAVAVAVAAADVAESAATAAEAPVAAPANAHRIQCIVADRGATVHAVSRELAEQLATAGMVAPYTAVASGSKEIVFGKCGCALEPFGEVGVGVRRGPFVHSCGQ